MLLSCNPNPNYPYPGQLLCCNYLFISLLTFSDSLMSFLQNDQTSGVLN